MSKASLTVLLIEDNPGDARLIREMLQWGANTDFSLQIANSLGDALAILREGSFEVILLDLDLPDGHGVELVDKIQAEFPKIPLVVLTGLEDEETGIRAVQAGAQDYLLKGEVDSQRIARSVRYAVERHHGVRRSRAAPDIFLSYSRKDTAIMQRILDDLRAAELKVWVDEEGLEPGTPTWEQAVSDAIRLARCVIVILSPDAERSVWVGRELALAETLDKRIFPLLARGGEKDAVPFRLVSHQRVDARHHYGEAIEKLLAAVKKYLATYRQ